MKNFDNDAFLADIVGICWEQRLTETDDDDVLVAHWSSLFSAIIDRHAPQGSCLIPLLFLIYIIDLPKAVICSTVSMHADGTSLCLKSEDVFNLEGL